MNKDVLILDDNYVVSTDVGNIKILNSTDEKSVMNILKKENEIEALESNIEEIKVKIIEGSERASSFKELKKASYIIPIMALSAFGLVSMVKGLDPVYLSIPGIFCPIAVALHIETAKRIRQIQDYIESRHSDINELEKEKNKKEEELEKLREKSVIEDKSKELLFDESLSQDKIKVLTLNKRY